MPRLRVYAEVIRGYYVDLDADDDQDALAQIYAMSVDDIERKGEMTFCDTGEHAEVVEELEDEEEVACNVES